MDDNDELEAIKAALDERYGGVYEVVDSAQLGQIREVVEAAKLLLQKRIKFSEFKHIVRRCNDNN